MIPWSLLLLILVPLVWRGVIVARSDSYSMGGHFVVAGIFGGTWLLATIIAVASVSIEVNTINRSGVLVEQVTEQRDVLLATVADELSAEQYEQLLDSTNDDEVLAILRDPSPILVERAQQVVALNRSVFDLQNGITRDSIGVCAYLDTPFAPGLPFVMPDCPLD